MPSLNDHIEVYTSTYDTFVHKCMSDEKAAMWHRKLIDFEHEAIDKAFDELFSTQKYAFQLVDILNCAKKHQDGHKVIKIGTDHLPPANPQNIKDLNQMIKAEADYKSGKISWGEFEKIALPFAGRVYEEDEKVGKEVMDRIEGLKKRMPQIMEDSGCKPAVIKFVADKYGVKL